jgi:hypothetical protein
METIVVQPENKEQINALKAIFKAMKIKFSIKKEKEYDPEFVAKVLKGDEDIKAGRTIKVTLDELWK